MTVEEAAAAGEDQEIISWFEGVAENAGLVQTQTLRRIIELNHRTEYLQKWLGRDLQVQDLDPAALESLFISSVPLACHADHEPYIQRIADGDISPLLTQEPISTLSLSSGTTDGRPKYVPFTRFSSQSTLQIFRLGAAYRSRVFPIRAGGRILEFIYSSKQFQTKGGLTAGTATTHYFASEEFKTKQKRTKCFTCSPYEVIAGGDYKQSTYCHLLLGLAFSDQVEFVTSTFAYSIVQAFAAFEELWEELCDDLRGGTLSLRVTSPGMRRAVMDCLSPNPSLASNVEMKCRELEGSDWGSLIPKLWPNAKYIYSIMTGSMQPYLKKLRHYAGYLALVCADYGSTESWIGVNLEPHDTPERVTFTVIPTFSYFEFIPLYTRNKKDNSNLVVTDDFLEGDPLPLSRVKVGQQYEIVLTTFTDSHSPSTWNSLTSKRPPFRPLQIQAWRRGGGGGILQRSPKINLYLQAEANTDREYRQEHRKGPPDSGRERVQAPEPDQGRGGRLHQPCRPCSASRPLRDLLGSQGRGRGRRPRRVLPGNGCVLRGPWLRGLEKDRFHRALGAPDRGDWHVWENTGVLHWQRCRHEPVQDTQVHHQRGAAEDPGPVHGQALQKHGLWVNHEVVLSLFYLPVRL
ncbi:indole-3-acetic acid-amido synthetase GH3.10 isoform X1 [Elaeis guineensis]|uniref:Indole-3-acetic acid-amido synthetase GH3.10 isoform X1 n=1 Tax=Elaeis guineensis var. tenera TaxID=51953 RepID=A0A8N4EZF3_ELAGV|nr:indole-3-acetic acid-amido synthetase GH3.10 isoform X1 [Elaeis guineensis]